MRNVSENICRENQNMHIRFNIFFTQKSYSARHMGKYCTAGQNTHENMVQEQYIMSSSGYRQKSHNMK